MLRAKFPTQRNRELFRRNRESRFRNRELFRSNPNHHRMRFSIHNGRSKRNVPSAYLKMLREIEVRRAIFRPFQPLAEFRSSAPLFQVMNQTPYCKRSGETIAERPRVSILFRTKEWLTLAQLARAWGDELAKDERGRQHYVQDLVHRLNEDIVNGRLDDSGPLHSGRRLGVRLITPESKAGFIEGHQLVDIFINDQTTRILNRVVIMKEAVLDFARRHQLPPPSWWTDRPDLTAKSTPASQATVAEVADPVAKDASQSVGKQPRIWEYFKEHYPKGVPNPANCPRKVLKHKLLKWDSRLAPLDDDTLKKAIDKHNAGFSDQST
jgi:hypothetical protein